MTPTDLIFDVLRAGIDEYRLSSFETFGLQIFVHPPKKLSREVKTARGKTIGYNKYVFDWWTESKTMTVRLNRSGEARISFNDK